VGPRVQHVGSLPAQRPDEPAVEQRVNGTALPEVLRRCSRAEPAGERTVPHQQDVVVDGRRGGLLEEPDQLELGAAQATPDEMGDAGPSAAPGTRGHRVRHGPRIAKRSGPLG
jgi:hypothetical protein